jgi:hypothetical protein
MKKNAVWDEAHLRAWMRERRQTILDRQIEADWQMAIDRTTRLRSEAERGPTRCPNRQCRRHRRCLQKVPACVPLRVALPPDLIQRVTEDHYTELQALRRAVARDNREWPL